MRHLFLTPGRHDEWLNLIQSGNSTALKIRQSLSADPQESKALNKGDPNSTARQNAYLDAHKKGCRAWIEGDKALAEAAWQELFTLLGEDPKSDLGKAGNALSAVLLWDFCNGLWEPEKRKAFASLLGEIARSFLEVTKGNPHIVTNNWWMLTHGGCLLACIAVDGEDGLDGLIDLSDLKAWALERFKAFCTVFGNAGLYHEGSGYISYTLSMLLPTMIAVQRHLEPDILETFPQFKQSIASMVVGTAAFEHTDNGSAVPSWGAALQWNDTGRGCLGLNPFIPGIELADEHYKGALRHVFDQLSGLSTGSLNRCHYSGLPLLVALYPFSHAPVDPEGILPKDVLDQRQGLGMWRDKWGNGSESVLGWYARATFAGGHAQDDAASIRLMSLGRTWICGGGQARPKAEWQSVFTHASESDRPRPYPLADLTCNHVHANGGVVGMDTRKNLGAYSERFLSWTTGLGKPLVLALMDLLDEHRDPPLDWQWNLSFPRDLAAQVHQDGAGFSLVDDNCGRLDARFLIDLPDRIEVREMPDSSRTFANGTRVDYPGDLFIHAAFPGLKKGRILVAMALSPAGRDRQTDLSFMNNAIVVEGRSWEHPFNPAILKSVDLAQSEPNRMTRPAG